MNAVAATSFNRQALIDDALKHISERSVGARVAKSLELVGNAVESNLKIAAELRTHTKTIFELNQKASRATDIASLAISRADNAEAAINEIADISRGNAKLQEVIDRHLALAAEQSAANTAVANDRADLTDERKETSAEGPQGNRQTRTDSPAPKPESPKQVVFIDGKTHELSQDLEAAAFNVVSALAENHLADIKQGKMQLGELVLVFNSDKTSTEPKDSSAVAKELQGFTQKISGKSMPETKAEFDQLSPHAQQVLTMVNHKYLEAIFGGDIMYLCAAAIKEHPGTKAIITPDLLKGYEAQLKAQPTIIDAKAETGRRAKFSAALGDLINSYKVGISQSQGIESASVKAKWQAQVKANFQNGLHSLFSGTTVGITVYKEDLARLEKHLSIVPDKASSTGSANDISNFANNLMKKLFSREGVSIAMFAMPLISPLIAHLPIIGSFLAGATTKLSQWAVSLSQMYNATQMFGGSAKVEDN